MEITGYRKKKAAGLVEVVKINDAPAVGIKRFCPDSGVCLGNQVFGVSIPDIDSQIAALEEQIAELQAFKADCEAVM